MAKHVFFERIGLEKITPVAGLLQPFNISGLDEIDTTTSYFDKTIYKNIVEPPNQKKIVFIGIIECAITRLIISTALKLENFGGYAYDKDGNFYVDYFNGQTSIFNDAFSKGKTDFSDYCHIIVKIDKSNKVSGVVIDEYGGKSQYLIRTRVETSSNRHLPCAAMFAVMAKLVSEYSRGNKTQLSTIFATYLSDIVNGFNNTDYTSVMKGMRAMDVDFYTLFAYPTDVASKYSGFCIDTEEFNKVDYDLLDNFDNIEFMDIVGDSKFFNGTHVQTPLATGILSKKKPTTIKEMCDSGEYSLGLPLTQEQELLVPTDYDNFIPSDITIDTAREIKVSSFDPIPARNFLWTGETGTGKTTESQLLATLLHVPYYSMNLSSDKQSSDLTVSCLPNNEKLTKQDIQSLVSRFPDAGTILANPKKAYEEITGVVKEDASKEDINLAIGNLIYEYANKATDFMYIDSPLVQAFRTGGIIELQEVNSCKAAILKSLNEALDDSKMLHLPTGEIVKRHKDCIVIVTANVGQGYEGINEFSNDFIGRFHQADVFELPSDDALVKRVKQRSGYNDEKIIKKMVEVMHQIKRELMESKGDSGSCSTRGLIAWARKTKNCGDPYAAAIKTIVGLSSQDPEIVVNLKSALETQFSPIRK